MTSLRALSIIAILTGLAVPLALAPFNFWPLMFVGVAGFYWVTLHAQTTRQALGLGWLYGIGYFGLGVSWIYGSMQTVDTPLWLSLVLTGGFCALMALFHVFQSWFFVRFLRSLPLAIALIAPLWWVINEWIREWFLTGMPWLYAGYAFTDVAIGQLGAVVGIYGLSLILAFCAAWLLLTLQYWFRRQQKTAAGFAGATLILLLISLLFGWLKPASSWVEPSQTLTVAAVQSNIDQRTKWSAAQQRPTMEFYGDSLSGMKEIDLILWPEAALTRLPEQIPYYLSQVNDISLNRDQAVLTGMLTFHDGRYYNAMRGYGTASGEYKKQHLVPFGEYVPLEKWLRGLIAFFDLPMSTMYPAPEPQMPMPFTLAGNPYFAAPVICYEAAYPGIVRDLARDANLITVVSNDAWFGDSIGPHQHLQITRMRAIENGRPILRATQNGISALIDADGAVLKRTEQFVAAELIGELELTQGLTPFQRLPAGTVISLVSLILAAWVARSRRLEH